MSQIYNSNTNPSVSLESTQKDESNEFSKDAKPAVDEKPDQPEEVLDPECIFMIIGGQEKMDIFI